MIFYSGRRPPRKAWRRALLLLTLSTAIPAPEARASDPLAEQVEERDENGKLTYARIRPENSNTARVFDDGVWMTRTYDEKNRTAMTGVEAPGESHTFSYDESFQLVSKTMTIGASKLSIRSEGGWISATGLPRIAIRADETGRVREIATPTGTLATFVFDPGGRSWEITLRSGFRLLTETSGNQIRQTLYASEGHMLYTSTFLSETRRKFVSKFNLDGLTPDLGLSYDWGRDLSWSISPTGYSEALSGTTGTPLVRIVRGIPLDRVGRGQVELVTLPDGKPIAYRIHVLAMAGGSTAFPGRIVVTPDDGIALDAMIGPRGSVISFWSRGGSSGFRVDAETIDAAEPRTTADGSHCLSAVCTASGSAACCKRVPYWCDGGQSWGGPRPRDATD
ncbi:MAG: hypothetical protein IPN83_09015 [Holophagales bacterium]|nr:hypothetical protein [Holophagales bacterium]